jgi:hypothetical protein
MEIGGQQSFAALPQSAIPSRQFDTDTNFNTRTSNPSSQSENNTNPQPPGNAQGLTQQDARIVQQLQSRDREVRSHEAAHIVAGAQLVSAASFTLQRGPDGRSYVVSGEVSIDTSAVPGDPEATLAKQLIVRRAALAPAQPSPQDLRVASQANQTAAQARVEIASLRANEAQQERDELVAPLAQNEAAASAKPVDEATDTPTADNEPLNSVSRSRDIAAMQAIESVEARAVTASLFA